MGRKRRSFSTEFKHEAACLVVDQGYSMTEACRSLDVGETGLRRRVEQLKAERGGITPVSKALTPDQQRTQELEARINRLEARINRLEGEEIILKKAWYGIPAALLMSDEWNRTNRLTN